MESWIVARQTRVDICTNGGGSCMGSEEWLDQKVGRGDGVVVARVWVVACDGCTCSGLPAGRAVFLGGGRPRWVKDQVCTLRWPCHVSEYRMDLETVKLCRITSQHKNNFVYFG